MITVRNSLLVLVFAAAALASLPAAAAGFTPIADCIVDGQNNVVVGGPNAREGCDNVEMAPLENNDNPPPFGEIRVGEGGTLRIAGYAGKLPRRQYLKDICIESGGTVAIGTKQDPITHAGKVELEFIGNGNDTSQDPACQGFAKGIDVTTGGSLEMYGAEGVPDLGGTSWTTLSAPAGPQVPGAKVDSTGPTTLHLTADVTKGDDPWHAGDWIVVATTTYTPFESEFVQIDHVESDGNGSTLTLEQPLKYYHFGSLAPSSGTCQDRLGKTEPGSFCDGPKRNYGVDERAEVGLISRDIELTADTTSSSHWGGEIMIHHGFKALAIQGVRLSKFGKAKLGSYPIHFHLVGDAGNRARIDADSVDHSYNKCVTIHATSDLTVSNLVCARIVGHIFYEELESAGDENPAADDGLVFDHDLGIGVMSNNFDIHPVEKINGPKISRQTLIDDYWWPGDYMTNDPEALRNIHYDGFDIPNTDNQLQDVHGSCVLAQRIGGLDIKYHPSRAKKCGADGTFYYEPASGFWIQNPTTVLEDNAIAGCQGVGRGVWWVPPNNEIKANGKVNYLKFEPLGTFKDNRVSGCYAGFYGENEYGVSSAQLHPHVGGVKDAQAVVATLDGVTATRNRFRGVWLRPEWFVIKNGRFAENRESVTLVTSGGLDGNAPGVWELLEDSVLVGESQNNVERWGPCPQRKSVGAVYWGTVRLH